MWCFSGRDEIDWGWQISLRSWQLAGLTYLKLNSVSDDWKCGFSMHIEGNKCILRLINRFM